MFENFLLFGICVAGLGVSLAVALLFLKSQLNVFHPFVILFSVAAIDVHIPGILWSLDRIPPQPPWVPALSINDITAGALFYLVGYMAMVAGFFFVSKRTTQTEARSSYELRESLLVAALWIFLILCFAQLLSSIISQGSLTGWFYQKLMVRWDGGLDGEGSSFLEIIPLRIAFNTLVIVGFCYRHELKRPKLLGYFFPFLALLLAAATFFRGSILVFLLGLLFVERLRTKRLCEKSASVAGKRTGVIDKTLIKWGAGALCLFLLYGGIRTQLSNESWGTEGRSEGSVSALARGDGLIGVSSIVKYFGNGKDLLLGKTYVDMLLLPVPRAIYPSKPKWYGIDDITRSMGWAESTQSAVTMPGEAFANFWIFSLLFMPVLGALFAAINKFAVGGGGVGTFLYPSAFLYLVINSNWMAFTGIVNQVFPIAVCACVLQLIFKTRSEECLELTN